MFDRHLTYFPGATSEQKITIKNAPTDESVRLLKEFEEAALKKIDETLRLNSNQFKGLIQHEFSFADDCHIFNVHFELNGHRLKLTRKFERFRDVNSIAQELKAEVAVEIAVQFLGEAFQPFLNYFEGKV